MKIIDLTHTVRQDMPVFPGTEQPVLQPVYTFEENGFREKKLTLYSHTGTHMDSPYHILKEGLSLDEQDVGRFMGRAVLIDCTGLASQHVGREHLGRYEALISQSDFVILKTGWSRFWGNGAYFKSFPTLTPDGANWLAQFKLKGVGVDTLSIDPVESMDLAVHRELLGNNINIVENLANLDSIEQDSFVFCCLPLKIEKADGSPVRAVAILD